MKKSRFRNRFSRNHEEGNGKIWEGHVSDVQNNYTVENCTISKIIRTFFVLRPGHRYISVFFDFCSFYVNSTQFRDIFRQIMPFRGNLAEF